VTRAAFKAVRLPADTGSGGFDSHPLPPGTVRGSKIIQEARPVPDQPKPLDVLKPASDLGLAVPLTEAVIASFERLARGEPTEDLVKALVAEVRRLRAEVERLKAEVGRG